jgi:hypothetical protein
MSKLKVAIIVIGAVSLLYAGRNAAQEGPEYRIGIIAPQSAGSVGAAEQQEAGIRAGAPNSYRSLRRQKRSSADPVLRVETRAAWSRRDYRIRK